MNAIVKKYIMSYNFVGEDEDFPRKGKVMVDKSRAVSAGMAGQMTQ